MKYLWTLDELLAIRTNGWSCDCGRAWLDVAGSSLGRLVVVGDPDCAHSVLRRAVLEVAA